jgi:2-keto-3-deoxy-6-phosphogluconate aldolase
LKGTGLNPYDFTAAAPQGAAFFVLPNLQSVPIGNYASAGSATVPSFITEIAGAAAPVTTPLSACLPSTPAEPAS